MEYTIIIPVLSILIIASIWDMKNKKIPNALIFFGLIAGVIVSTVSGGFSGFYHSILAILLVFLAFILTWGAVGAGDIKLLMVMAAFLGTGMAIKIGFFSFLLGAIVFSVIKPYKVVKAWKDFSYFVLYKVPIQVVSKSKAIAFSPFILIAYVYIYFFAT